MARLSPDDRRQAILDATLAVARRQGLGASTVRDVAAEMGTSSGLIHHYFDSMDDVLAAAFEQAAGGDLARARERIAAIGSAASASARSATARSSPAARSNAAASTSSIDSK